MAEPSENRATMFIINARIQNKRLTAMKVAARTKNIVVADIFSDAVTHVVTEHTDFDAALRSLRLSDDSQLCGATIVTTAWFADCMKAGRLVTVTEAHRVQQPTQPQTSRVLTTDDHNPPIAEYACQRSTPLKHHNEKFTTALEILEKHADLREGDHDYSRALAFRRASCVLKSLPFPLTSIGQLQNLSFIGDHSRRIIQEILEDGESGEVESIRRDPWFHKMKLFSGVFGVGPSTAKKWIEKGWSSIAEAQQGRTSSDWRQRWGLGFHDDLSTPVQQREADHILTVVKGQLDRLLPGAVMSICGGFRRGKAAGHDVDILITHPDKGREIGLLPRLVQHLTDRDVILCGKLEKSTFTSEVLYTDSKLTARGQLDHFEKWLGICKVPKNVGEGSNSDQAKTVLYVRGGEGSEVDADHIRSKHVNSKEPNTSVLYTRRGEESDVDTDHVPSGKRVDCEGCSENVTVSQPNNSGIAGDCCALQDSVTKCVDDNDIPPSDSSQQRNSTIPGSVDDFEPKAKRQRTGEDSDLSELSSQPRDWIARRVDLIVCPYSQYYYALVGWTGNKMFNRDLRWYSERKFGLKLSSHGLYSHSEGRSLPAASEKEVFDHLKIPYREPWERNC